jgi:glycosyltransferase involved in cell wall biosynthesis
MRTAHIITRLILGGAQENTLFNVDDQHHIFKDEVCLITGPGAGPEGSLEQRARERGLDLRVLPELGRSIRPWQDLLALRAIRRTLRSYQPEIVHTHSSKAGILGRLAAHQLKIPAVHTIHGAAFHYGQNPLAWHTYRLAERLAAGWCQRLISVCNAMTTQYLAAGIGSPEQYTTIYSGMDVDRFLNPQQSPAEMRRQLGLEPHHIVFGKVARLFHLKGHNHLIEAAPAVANAIPHARFLLVGDGILREHYQQRINELGLASHFRFTGLVPPEQVSDYIHAMDVVVHTSDWEGLPRVLPQALLAAKPVIAFNIDGAPEVCIPNVTGLLAEHRNIPQLTHAMLQLGSQSELRNRLGLTGRDRCSQIFRHEFMTEQIRGVYRSILQNHTPTQA